MTQTYAEGRDSDNCVPWPRPMPAAAVTFSRQELDAILCVYGAGVIDGLWRDYAIDHMRERAVFSIFRRSSEMPLYSVAKEAKLARRQGLYSVVAATGLILKRGHDLKNVLKVFERKKLKVVA